MGLKVGTANPNVGRHRDIFIISSAEEGHH
jgi:hypothetical protein